VATALTALSLFDLLRFPLFMLPQVVNNVRERICMYIYVCISVYVSTCVYARLLKPWCQSSDSKIICWNPKRKVSVD
jgi:hypothetical protein